MDEELQPATDETPKVAPNRNIPWMWLSQLYTALARDIVQRDTITAAVYDPVNGPPDQPTNTSAWNFLYDHIDINGWYLPPDLLKSKTFVSRDKLDIRTATGVANSTAMLGIAYHECGHAVHTRWKEELEAKNGRVQFQGRNLTAQEMLVAEWLEELRCEYTILKDHPEALPHLTNAYVRELELWREGDLPDPVFGGLLTLGRREMNLLDTREHPKKFNEVFSKIKGIVSPELQAALPDICTKLKTIGDSDAGGMLELANEVIKITQPPQEVQQNAPATPGMLQHCSQHNDSNQSNIQQAMQNASMNSSPGQGQGGQEGEKKPSSPQQGSGKQEKSSPESKSELEQKPGDGDGNANADGADQKSDSPSGKPKNAGQAGLNAEQVKQAIKALLDELGKTRQGITMGDGGEGSRVKVQIEPINALDPPIELIIGGHGFGPGEQSTITIHKRRPSGTEKSLASKFAKRLESLRLKERERELVGVMAPPGRLRTRGLIQSAALAEQGITASPEIFKRRNNTLTQRPKMKVAIGVDISGSMGGVADHCAKIGWVIAQGMARNECEYGFYLYKEQVGRVHPLEMRGSNVYEWQADGGSESIGTMLEQANKDLQLDVPSQDGIARVVILVSDFYYVNDTEKVKGIRNCKKLTKSGVKIFAIGPEESYEMAKANLPGCTFIKWGDSAEVTNSFLNTLVKEMQREADKLQGPILS